MRYSLRCWQKSLPYPTEGEYLLAAEEGGKEECYGYEKTEGCEDGKLDNGKNKPQPRRFIASGVSAYDGLWLAPCHSHRFSPIAAEPENKTASIIHLSYQGSNWKDRLGLRTEH